MVGTVTLPGPFGPWTRVWSHASTHENRAGELMLEDLTSQGVIDGLELVLVDRGVAAPR